MPMACSNALGDTAVTSAPWAPPDLFLEVGDRIGGLCIDCHGGAQALGQVELGLVHVHGGHLQAHRLGVLHRHMTEAADAGDHHPIAGFGIGDLQALVHGHAGAQHRCDFDEADITRQVADVVGIGQGVFGETAIDRVARVFLLLAQRLPAAKAVLAVCRCGCPP
jgi:hypothetical protein